jgi:hypothetical protein
MDMEHIMSDFYLLGKHGFGTEENSAIQVQRLIKLMAYLK